MWKRDNTRAASEPVGQSGSPFFLMPNFLFYDNYRLLGGNQLKARSYAYLLAASSFFAHVSTAAVRLAMPIEFEAT